MRRSEWSGAAGTKTACNSKRTPGAGALYLRRRTAEIQIIRVAKTIEQTISNSHTIMDQNITCAFRSLFNVPVTNFMSSIFLLTIVLPCNSKAHVLVIQ
jgi:hypothetical protein